MSGDSAVFKILVSILSSGIDSKTFYVINMKYILEFLMLMKHPHKEVPLFANSRKWSELQSIEI